MRRASFPGILQLVFYGPTDVVITVILYARGEKDSVKPQDCFGPHEQSRREKERVKPKNVLGRMSRVSLWHGICNHMCLYNCEINICMLALGCRKRR